ncbi:MAG TPA: hypothetical protein PK020_07400 [Ilumatobacteraceae bacterium]|nr:hypothetical protein [Ilumatobacteraceae bacterium]HRB04330.1 hypothetical protein [Ilumatobacteraceae bacterium]
MPFIPRFRVPGRGHPALHLQSDDHHWGICYPDPDEPIIVAGFGEAAMLATDVLDLPVQREVVVLLDERRRVTALLLDPPCEIGVFVAHADLPGIEAPFCQTMCIVLSAEVYTGAPRDADRRGYQALRRAHMAQGLLLLDVILTDGDTVRSLAIGCDPDPVWFDEFDPMPDQAAATRDPAA